MKAKKKSKKAKKTHHIIEVPNAAGKYVNNDGERVNLHKIPTEKSVSTLHKVHTGTTIKQFLEDKGYSNAK